MTNTDLARDFLKAIEQDADVTRFYAPDAQIHLHPNLLAPRGEVRDLQAVAATSAKGRQVVGGQRYEVQAVLSDEDQVAMRLRWSATLKVPVGKTPAGGTMTADFGLFLRFRDGKILEQHNYDCFLPF